ncbi:uncharacterized protein LY89DRAFT_721150 [Mollisia scopiformis]|uniref:Uncharacterized protein n=1 Tax=Mollisia scopiformis TaxID=149040 RepID=A0A194X2D3_MOLSC|nr:uncharacterized protein LY89DRAFT_721150 [Mollisia scopiformis]KUJ13997.1 hypothetical protein LY89DRAFT_721150 [Mollisia scopiformis]
MRTKEEQTNESRTHDHDPVTPTPAQRQQPRSLRRTHIEATSAGISPPPRVRFEQEQRTRSEFAHDFEDDLTSTQLASSSQQISPEAERRPHRALRISKNTASAILYALEEALRHPNAFTPDLVEENAQMSDLLGGGPSASAGNGRSNNGRTAQPPPGTTGSPSGIKGPRDIMRERQAREARRKVEQEQKEALERNRAAEEQRQIQIEEERRRRTAGAAQRGSGDTAQRTSGGTAGGPRISDNSQRSQRTSGGGAPGNPALQGVGQGGRAVGGGESAGGNRPRPSQAPSQPRPVQAEAREGRAKAEAGSSAGPSGTQPTAGAGTTRSSFPHAFERWETLSAHWEGLTSFWIRRLEENSIEVNRDPLSQQLSRQVTDLSAAGANLFHAVVELQRLRASSERKFQRWFFETRAELERAQEIQAMTQAALEQERAERSGLIEAAVARDRNNKNYEQQIATLEKQVAEGKREQQISKEEARRAWEELGRREEDERERTASLRDGQPTLVGGVQVVPMMQGVPSRHGSTRQPQTGTYAGESGSSTQPEGPVDEGGYSEYVRGQREPADPFTTTTTGTSSRQTPATYPGTHPAFTNSSPQGAAPAVQPASTSGFYQQHQGTSLHPTEAERNPSPAAFSEEEYEIDSQGQFIRDSRGNKVRYQAPASDEDDDEYDVAEQREREIANLARYGQTSSGPAAVTTAGRTSGPTSAPSMGPPVDYTGSAYDSAPAEWAAVPRHHHPTRLSDVLEEDERSRTSASQVSRRD